MMIKFNLQNFEPIPEGNRLLKIIDAKCVPSGKPSKMEITFEDTETRRTLKNNYNFSSEGGLKALGFLCRVALDLPDMDEFDTTTDTPKLVGRVLECEVTHTEGTNPREDGTFPVFANITKTLGLVDVEKQSVTTQSPRNSIPSGDLD